jgi:hypothetical protein
MEKGFGELTRQLDQRLDPVIIKPASVPRRAERAKIEIQKSPLSPPLLCRQPRSILTTP